jgi:hypothetical protein
LFGGGVSELKAKLEKWAFQQNKQASELLDLLWPVIESAVSAEKYLDILGYLPAQSRQRELSEELWEVAMFEREKLDEDQSLLLTVARLFGDRN